MSPERQRQSEQTFQEIHTTTPATENTLEILKAIRESAFARWEKRRDYEWRLSFGIWTALAAFIAITLSRDLKVELTSMVTTYAAVGAISIFLAHAFYLTGIIEHTIVDVKTQYLVEESLASRLPTGLSPLPKTTVRESRLLARVGYFQAIITAILATAAVLSLVAPRVPLSSSAEHKAITQPIK